MNLLPHQRDAVVRAQEILGRYGGVILADDVGLGKSYVAAALALAARERGDVVELVVPAMLVEQWRAFALDAHIVTHDALAGEPFVPDLTCERLVVVDEAHAFRNRQTQRWAALARRSVAARLLLITATPFCNSVDDLHALIVLIAADDALRAAGVASIDDAFVARDVALLGIVLRELVIRRTRDVLPPELRFGALARNVIRYDVYPARGIDALRFPLAIDAPSVAMLRHFLWRRLESSEAALLASLKRQTRFYERALESFACGRTLTKRDYRRAFGDEDGDSLQQVLFWDVFAAPGDAPAAARDVEAELHRIDAIAADVRGSPRAKESLLVALCAALHEPALVFTSAIATAYALRAALQRAGVRVAIATTGENAVGVFTRGDADVLVATDLASEGLNLQRAGVVIHYDIPWNPVKLDQRNGRAHRLGQMRDEVRAIYFVESADVTRVMHIVAAKNRARRRLLAAPHASFPAVDARLPPHLPRDSAAVALRAALIAQRVDVPAALVRRHRAGIELVMREMANEFLDVRRVEHLVAMIGREPGRELLDVAGVEELFAIAQREAHRR
jgi:superfamily II DNA or RNA helicase